MKRNQREGAVAIECAIALPILLLMIFSTVEICNFIFLKQTLTVAAYEGARVAIVPGSTAENVVVQMENILRERGVEPKELTITPSDFNLADSGAIITVTANAYAADNSLIGSALSNDRVITASVQMMKEF